MKKINKIITYTDPDNPQLKGRTIDQESVNLIVSKINEIVELINSNNLITDLKIYDHAVKPK